VRLLLHASCPCATRLCPRLLHIAWLNAPVTCAAAAPLAAAPVVTFCMPLGLPIMIPPAGQELLGWRLG
jgi:hypothetical protein